MARRKKQPIEELRAVMSRLRAPDGCPWDQEQDHRSIRLNAVEEVYELVDAIEAGDDGEKLEELGDSNPWCASCVMCSNGNGCDCKQQDLSLIHI